jgi:hypothetical protein
VTTDNNLPALLKEYIPLLKHYSRLHECAWNYYANSTTLHKTARQELHAALFDATTYTPAEEQLRAALSTSIALNKKLVGYINEVIEENLHLADGDNCTLFKLKQARELAAKHGVE